MALKIVKKSTEVSAIEIRRKAQEVILTSVAESADTLVKTVMDEMSIDQERAENAVKGQIDSLALGLGFESIFSVVNSKMKGATE